MTHIIGQDGNTTANPLVMLAQALQTINVQLAAIADHTRPRIEHRYSLIEGRDSGQWLSYCEACSEEAQEFTHPCQARKGEAVPPPMFAVSPEDVVKLAALAPKGDGS